MYKIVYSSQFKRDLKLARKRKYNLKLLYEVIELLIEDIELPLKYRDHELKGTFEGFRECHVSNDWLLVYCKVEKELELYLFRTTSHSDLFK